MKIDVHFTPLGLGAADLAGRGVVVIDVLRATTTIITALANGAKAVIPAATSEEAVRLASNLEKDGVLLAGERRSVKIEGFALGGSEAAHQLSDVDLDGDVDFAARPDRFGVVPTYADRRIT